MRIPRREASRSALPPIMPDFLSSCPIGPATLPAFPKLSHGSQAPHTHDLHERTHIFGHKSHWPSDNLFHHYLQQSFPRAPHTHSAQPHKRPQSPEALPRLDSNCGASRKFFHPTQHKTPEGHLEKMSPGGARETLEITCWQRRSAQQRHPS